MTVAFWCVLVGVMLPYVSFGVAMRLSRAGGAPPPRDNHTPRDFPQHLTGAAKRAWGAHLNAFEALPAFAAAVIIAHLAGASQSAADLLSAVWVAARIAFLVFYVGDRPGLRSAAQSLGMLCVLGLFAAAAFGAA